MAKVLALETATTACSAALFLDGLIIDRFQIAPRQQSDLLLHFVDEVLGEASCALSELDALAVSSGPGSFMGVRLATGVAQGLAFGADLPVVPASTLQALAQAGYTETKASRVIVGWDARMGEVYWGVYELDSSGLMCAVLPDRLDKPEHIALEDSEPCVAIGNAWSTYQDEFSPALQSQLVVSNNDVYPSARAMLPYALQAYKEGSVVSAAELEACYLREKVTY